MKWTSPSWPSNLTVWPPAPPSFQRYGKGIKTVVKGSGSRSTGSRPICDVRVGGSIRRSLYMYLSRKSSSFCTFAAATVLCTPADGMPIVATTRARQKTHPPAKGAAPSVTGC